MELLLPVFALFLASGVGAVGSTYLGCYVDYAGRQLAGSNVNSGSLTPKFCIGHCTKLGFKLAGLEVGSQCFCGDDLDDDSKVDDSQCGSACGGDKLLKCGGPWRLSVHRTTVPGFNPVEDSYVGCYVDYASRLLSGAPRNASDSQTPQACLELCRTKGFKYSGTEVGQECFCGDSLKGGTAVDDKECNVACKGDTALRCGAGWRLSVYYTLAPGKKFNPISDNYKGCYNESGEAHLNGYRKVSKSLTPFLCYRLCRKNGFTLAGLRRGTECQCGDWADEDDKIGDLNCKMPCAGDLSLTCGGDSAISVYETKIKSEPISTYIGCYEDEYQSRILDGIHMESESLTIESCVGFCYRRGFMFAGAKSGDDCYCGNSLKRRRRVASSKCQVPCSGNFNQICGASSVLSVYQTGITYAQLSESGQSTYMGCYVDSDERQLFGARRVSDVQNTEFCIGFCGREGYSLAGLEASKECYCGDRLKEGSSAEDKDCSSDCPGNPNSKCGGGWRLSVYSTAINGWQLNGYHVGCFNDDGPKPLLDGASKGSALMTVDYCFGFCYRNGFKFAGLKKGYKCNCGNTLRGLMPVGNSRCKEQCKGEKWMTCGGEKTLTVYNTGVVDPPKGQADCKNSETRYNGKPACSNQLVFLDDFDKGYVDPRIWSSAKYGPPLSDSEFVVFSDRAENAYVKDGKLYVKPTLSADIQLGPSVERGPGIWSARVHTSNSFSFRYGQIQIRAKLPKGDWVIPELWLRPKGSSVDKKGSIQLAMARGNAQLKKDTIEIGNSKIEFGVIIGSENDANGRNIIDFFNSEGWHRDFHNFTLTWKPDNLFFSVDDSQEVPLINDIDVRFANAQDGDVQIFNKYSQWSRGTSITPFNKEFYISFGVTVGSRDFPDESVSGNYAKPWKNGDPMAMYNFWSQKDNWLPTWKDEECALQVDYVKVQALEEK